MKMPIEFRPVLPKKIELDPAALEPTRRPGELTVGQERMMLYLMRTMNVPREAAEAYAQHLNGLGVTFRRSVVGYHLDGTVELGPVTMDLP